jgi:hypothetical protein
MLRPFLQPGEIEMLTWPIIVANHFQKFECTCVPGTFTWTQRAEYLADCPVLVASGYRDEHARRMVAE